MAQRTAGALERGAEVVVQDVPLLFENRLEGLFPTVVVVWVSPEVQVERLIGGRGFTPERAREVIGAQMPIDEKRGLATHLIDNTGTVESTRAQVESLWEKLNRD
jgi:dephospho-CoA kinase